MIRSKDWTRWVKVFVLMSVFSIVQIPLTQYALGGLETTSFHDREQFNLRAVNNIEEIDIDYLKINHISKDEPAYSGSIDQGIKERSNNELQVNNLEKINLLEKTPMPIAVEQHSSMHLDTNSRLNNDKDTKILKPINESNYKEQSQEEFKKKEDQSGSDIPNIQGLQSGKYVYLTVDDGPSGVSAELLDILAAKKVLATFFVLEPRVRSYPDIMNRMVNEGHEIGIHGVTHNVKKFYASRESAVKEINETKEALREVAGKDSILVRTPYGSSPYLSHEQEEAIREEGYKIWDWNVDSRDWYHRNDDYVRNSITQVQRLTAKGIAPVILVHELDSTAKHLAKLLDYLVENGYEFRTLNINDEPVRLR